MKRTTALLLAALLAALVLGMGTAFAAPRTIQLVYFENYYPYPAVSDYTLPASVSISEGQTFSYSQVTSKGFTIDGVLPGSPSSIAYADSADRLNILVTRLPRPVGTIPPTVSTTPGIYGYGYYYGADVYAAQRLIIGPKTYQATRGKSYTFKNCRTGVVPVPADELLWTSSDESIVSVTRPGVVRARKAGTAVITAATQIGFFRASVEFVVR